MPDSTSVSTSEFPHGPRYRAFSIALEDSSQITCGDAEGYEGVSW